MRKIILLILAGLIIFTNCDTSSDKNETTLKIAIVGDSIQDGVNAAVEVTGLYGWVHMLNGESYSGIPAQTVTIRSIWSNAAINNFAISGSIAAEWNSTSSLDMLGILYEWCSDIYDYRYYKSRP